MAIAAKQLTAVNDESRLNASEALSGSIVFTIEQVSGTWTIVFESKVKGAPDTAFRATQAVNTETGTLVTSTTQAAPGNFRIDASGQLEVRARMSVSGPGVANVYPGVSLG